MTRSQMELAIGFRGGYFNTMMDGNVVMNQPMAAVIDHHEHVQQSKGGSDGDQEIASNDTLRV
jgi:hypothetical protein